MAGYNSKPSPRARKPAGDPYMAFQAVTAGVKGRRPSRKKRLAKIRKRKGY